MLIVSIALEAAVAILAVLAARRGKPYIYGLAFTFGAYVLYDLARLLHWNVQAGILSWLFLLATISALIAVWGLYRAGGGLDQAIAEAREFLSGALAPDTVLLQ